VLHAGRIKPFATAAQESLLAVTTKSSFGVVESTPEGQRLATRHRAVDLVTAMLLHPDQWGDRPLVAVPWQPLQRAMGLNGQWASLNELRRQHVRLDDAVARRERSRSEVIPWTTDDQKTYEVAERFSLALDLLAGRTIFLAPLARDAAEREALLAALVPALADEPTRDRAWRLEVKRAMRLEPGRSAAALFEADPWLSFEDLLRVQDPLLRAANVPPGISTLASAAVDAATALDRGATPESLTPLVTAMRERGEARSAERHAAKLTERSYPSASLIRAELSYCLLYTSDAADDM
jgi:hypothetical protein